MNSARPTRDLRDPRGTSVAGEASLPRGRRRAMARDASEFLGLLAKTFYGLPADVIAASVVINLLGLALPLAILQVYDRVIPHAATSTLLFLILGVCFALILEGILRITRGQVIAWQAMKEAWKTNVDAASRVALAPARLVDREPAARWMQRFQGVATTSEFQLSPSLLVLVDLPFMLIFLALLFAISPLLAAIPLVLFLLFGIGAIARSRELRAATVDRALAEAKIRDFLVEALNGIVTVKALAMEQQVLRRFERLAEQASGCTYNLVRLSDDAQSFGSLVSTLTQMTTATVGAVFAINGEISIGALACCTMLSARVIQPLLRLVSTWNEIQAVMVAKETAKPIFDLPGHIRVKAVEAEQAIPARITFDNVTFAHEGEEVPVLVAADLCVNPGEIIAITGPDGIGKSTTARLAMGQLIPQSGQVLIDDTPAVQAGTGASGILALVDHQVASIRGTVLNNLTMYRDGEGVDGARAAARLIGLEDDINKLPRGYETRLGEAATEALPPGLLQRIVIARAIASRPRLLILDEANSSFDYRSDQMLARGLLTLKQQATIIIITNRPSFAAIADRIVTIVDGKFVQLGVAPPKIESVAASEKAIA
jgi:ATP-binding cassette, subfamily C, bacterial LapB